MPSSTSGLWQGDTTPVQQYEPPQPVRTMEARHEPLPEVDRSKEGLKQAYTQLYRDPNLHRDLRSANIARDAEWNPNDQISWEFRSNELAGEAGEVCNVVKKLARERMGIRGSRDTVEHLAEELADVIICVDLLAMMFNIDLDAAVSMKFNNTSEANGLKTRLSL